MFSYFRSDVVSEADAQLTRLELAASKETLCMHLLVNNIFILESST